MQPATQIDRLLTASQVADVLAIGLRTLWQSRQRRTACLSRPGATTAVSCGGKNRKSPTSSTPSQNPACPHRNAMLPNHTTRNTSQETHHPCHQSHAFRPPLITSPAAGPPSPCARPTTRPPPANTKPVPQKPRQSPALALEGISNPPAQTRRTPSVLDPMPHQQRRPGHGPRQRPHRPRHRRRREGLKLFDSFAPDNMEPTLAFSTGKGKRLLFRWPAGHSVPIKSIAVNGHEALRILGAGSQTVAPPSIHPTGPPIRLAPRQQPR